MVAIPVNVIVSPHWWLAAALSSNSFVQRSAELHLFWGTVERFLESGKPDMLQTCGNFSGSVGLEIKAKNSREVAFHGKLNGCETHK
jgi:hypothetical protein